MPRILILLLAILLFAPAALAETNDGMITVQSHHSVAVTIDRLEKVLKQKGLTIFARVDHAAGGNQAGISLRPTQVLIFGNPKLGTPLMTSNQTVGIDLPQKALAWEDATGKVWLTYNDPAYLAERHHIGNRAEVLAKIAGALKDMTAAAAGR